MCKNFLCILQPVSSSGATFIIHYNTEPENEYWYNLQTLFRFLHFYMPNCVHVYVTVCVGV